MKKVYFTVGPTQTNPNFVKHIAKAIRLRIPSISHRSDDFHKIYAELDGNLKKLWKIPSDYKILFFSSATEIWDRLAQNCVQKDSLHFVTGSFGEKHAKAIEAYGKTSFIVKNDFIDERILTENVKKHKNIEYIAFTHNESSMGVKTPENLINKVKKISPKSLVVVDAVSSAPLPKFNFKNIDGVYFSVQKCFGLPAGLGVLIASPRLIDKSKILEKKQLYIGTYHGFPKMMKMYEKWETVETPNVLNIYLLNEAVKDMAKLGLSEIRKINKTNKIRIIEYMKEKFGVLPAVQKPIFHSDTVLVFDTGEKTAEIKKNFAKKGVIVGSGYGEKKISQIRIANFPQHAKVTQKLFTT
ncbi:MAG: aminotransferase class V-fold PLP-dependent enzyme [Patescibacteria group bacterium]